ncbi:MAG: hypothetical protein CTY15_10255 [Methylocystis sp.]|nr:MAG: hypothetical protein CTY15_10255 [Methylocystis sp.]
MAKLKPQRIRDPVHNLIEFDTTQFESTLWRVIQTRPFQRLRRVRQLGFSEFVFPGATHTRFAHSVGVFHMARLLMKVIERYVNSHQQQFKAQQAHHTLAAALLHDVGHGMFSHAFEAVGKEFSWQMARHEAVSQNLIRNSEITEALDKELGKGFADNVADVIAQEIPNSLYGSIVSSQFDADRLDYMQRDRLMTGVQSSSVDPTWLLANLEVAEVATGADEESTGLIETLVLGPKAVQTAESYVLALFHLYPNVYLHKTTRGAEMVFKALIQRIVRLQRAGLAVKSGLPDNHPIIQFIADPKNLQRALALDDTVFWGALPMLAESSDAEIKRLTTALRERQLTKCVDLRRRVEAALPLKRDEDRRHWQARVKLICDEVAKALKKRNPSQEEEKHVDSAPTERFLIDQYSRNPYKRYQDSKSPLNQILIRTGDGPPRDMGEISPIIAHAETFYVCRAYIFRDDKDADSVIENELRTKIGEIGDGK